jgi:hypothetical protein
MSEPVVLHHGLEGGVVGRAAVCFNGLLGSLVRQCVSNRERRSDRRLRLRADQCDAS